MDSLKKLRLAHGFTQDRLAEMLETTQQTIARWETGKSEPSIAALRDLALIFGTSVDDLLGRNPFAATGKDSITTNRYHLFARSDEGFWGHLGIRSPGASKSTWYPITLREANRISGAISSATRDAPWIVATTLNNRALLINVESVRQISILDDNADEVADDWELGWDSYQGHSPEVYRALEDHFLGFGDDDSSEAFKGAIEDLIEQEELDQDKCFKLILTTRVHYDDGTLRELHVDDEASWSAFCEIEQENDTLTLDLSDRESGLDVFIARSQVALVDMPLHRMSDAAKSELETCESEKAQAIAVGAVSKARQKAGPGRPSKSDNKKLGSD